MKFLCVDCDEAMKLERTGGPDNGSMAVLFACPSCGRKVAMLTNSMETQMVRSLGVKIGGEGGGQSAPMERLRGSLVGAGAVRKEAEAGQSDDADDDDAESTVKAESDGKCPFTGMVKEAFERDAAQEAELVWTADAIERLERIPAYVRSMVEKGIVEYAKERGVDKIDGAVMDEARGRFGM